MKITAVPDDDDEVGYGKPPKKHRFQKGQSGNPQGRPKKLKPMDELFAIALAKKVKINGEILTKQEVIVEALIQHAVKGKPTAMQIMLERMAALEANETVEFDPLLADQIAMARWLSSLEPQKPEANVS
ncbi:MAG TPA: DUF5681 domain-containing protein [Luteolibacter sp.]